MLVIAVAWLVTSLVRRQLAVADDPEQIQVRSLVGLTVARVAVCLRMVFGIGAVTTGVSIAVKQLIRCFRPPP
ncbi:hypothetical protein [Micromonospora sp. ATCC 39149]|uniref:hypothetical protein n=1 Tax=Micromonospora sp. (strain ATCC 39149 / NRRL 15099 / SCC 1413) TaxID=219305 RepID=UPI001E525087|nr:hypothetical protein [Micromonospora sp. ATCC 39149]